MTTMDSELGENERMRREAIITPLRMEVDSHPQGQGDELREKEVERAVEVVGGQDPRCRWYDICIAEIW